jgi:hypothetical protein
MFACLIAAAALTTAPMEAIPALSAEVHDGASALVVMVQSIGESTAFQVALADFSNDSMALSEALRTAGVTADLPCIFKGIAEDARARALELQTAQGPARAFALSGLRALLDDAILLAPQAGAEVVKLSQNGTR